MKQLLYAILICSTLLNLLNGCKDHNDNPTENPSDSLDKKPNDPCLGKTMTSAAFEMRETGGWKSTIPTLSDTTISGSKIIFQALQDCDSYEWKVGEDTRTWSTKSFTLGFSGFDNDELPAQIPIRLIVKRSIDTTCIHLKNDDGIDTVTKILTILRQDQSAMQGVFLGADTDTPSDTFRVTIKYVQIPYVSDPPSVYVGGYVLFNIHKGCQSLVPESDTLPEKPTYPSARASGDITYKTMYSSIPNTTRTNGCNGSPLYADATLNRTNDTIRIQYTYHTFLEPGGTSLNRKKISKVFIGRRVQ